MACSLENSRIALYVLGIFIIPEGCTNAVGSCQPGASVRTPQLNLYVYKGSGRSQKGQKMNILSRYIFWLNSEILDNKRVVTHLGRTYCIILLLFSLGRTYCIILLLFSLSHLFLVVQVTKGKKTCKSTSSTNT